MDMSRITDGSFSASLAMRLGPPISFSKEEPPTAAAPSSAAGMVMRLSADREVTVQAVMLTFLSTIASAMRPGTSVDPRASLASYLRVSDTRGRGSSCSSLSSSSSRPSPDPSSPDPSHAPSMRRVRRHLLLSTRVVVHITSELGGHAALLISARKADAMNTLKLPSLA